MPRSPNVPTVLGAYSIPQRDYGEPPHPMTERQRVAWDWPARLTLWASDACFMWVDASGTFSAVLTLSAGWAALLENDGIPYWRVSIGRKPRLVSAWSSKERFDGLAAAACILNGVGGPNETTTFEWGQWCLHVRRPVSADELAVTGRARDIRVPGGPQ